MMSLMRRGATTAELAAGEATRTEASAEEEEPSDRLATMLVVGA